MNVRDPGEALLGASASAGAGTARADLFTRLFPAIYTSAIDGIILTSTDGSVHAANPAACEIFGRSEEELCQLGRAGVVNLGDPRLSGALAERQRTGQAHAELTVVRPDGSIVPVELTSVVLTEPGPSSPSVIFIRDVHEAVEAREALDREKALLARVFSNLEDTVFVVDLEARAFVRVNDAVERLLGWTPAELEGRKTTCIHPTPEAFETVGRTIEEGFRAAGFAAGEIELLRRDGTTVPVRHFSRPLGEADASIMVTVAHDLTEERRRLAERERLAAALVEAQKLESLGTLAGGLAHDFNNILASILATASIGEATPEALEDITAAARTGAQLVRQLLAYAGRGPSEVVEVDLSAMVRDSIALLTASLPREVVLEIAVPETPIRVLADPTQMRQVLASLVLNAAEVMTDRGGRVVIRAGVERCDAGHPALALARPPLVPGEYSWLEVSDDGPGMSPEVASRVFDPFFSTHGLGRGLGLASVAGIVRGHGGAHELDTAPGHGARLRAWLPSARPAAPEPKRAVAAPVERGRRRRVLLVDDEDLVRRAARRVLESAGYEVIDAPDGAKALERFREAPATYDGALIDMVMPGMNGEETLAAIHALRPDLPAVLASGYGPSALERLAGGAKARFTSKPYDRTELLAALATAGI